MKKLAIIAILLIVLTSCGASKPSSGTNKVETAPGYFTDIILLDK